MNPPPHHHPDGGFRAPWLQDGLPTFRDFLRWRWERLTTALPPDPSPGEVPRETPDPARPGASNGELRVTWLGHATFLVQMDGVNLLTDPVLSHRASPISWLGPSRLSPAPLQVSELPEIHAAVLSHDHYDHLDLPTVKRLRDRFGDTLNWITPLGYQGWFEAVGVDRVTELDWWETADVRAAGRKVSVRSLPAQHWTRRRFGVNRRLWASYAFRTAGERAVYFGGDSGYFPGYREIAREEGMFDAVLLPIGAYEPRWFMKTAHMNPEDAVQAYLDLGGEGAFVGMHWGTFRLTDEDPLEPPVRARSAWARAGLPPDRLHLPGIGGTLQLP